MKTSEASTGLSAVIITHNRAAEAIDSVGRMRALPEVERVIVIDNASGDGTFLQLVRRYPEVMVLPLPENLGAAARNVGVELAPTPYVALCDDDTWWEPGSLQRAVAVMDAHPRIAIVTARVLVEPGARLDPACQRMARTPLGSDALPGAPVLGFLAGAAVVRRAAFLEAGGFDPRLFFGREEGLLAYDLAARGWLMRYLEELVVHHRPSPNRNAAARSLLLMRNSVYIAWLRLPMTVALAHTLAALAQAAHAGMLNELTRELSRALPWLLAERRVLPAAVERARRLVARAEPRASRRAASALPGAVR